MEDLIPSQGVPAAANAFLQLSQVLCRAPDSPLTVIQKALDLWKSFQKPQNESTVIQNLRVWKHTFRGAEVKLWEIDKVKGWRVLSVADGDVAARSAAAHPGRRAAWGTGVRTSRLAAALSTVPNRRPYGTGSHTLWWAPARPPVQTRKLRLGDCPRAKGRPTLSLEAHSKSPPLQVGPGSSHVPYQNEIQPGRQTHTCVILDP